MAKKKVDVEKVSKVVAQLPWGDIVKLTSKLVLYARGGITKEEALELSKDLIALASELTGQAEKCEG